MAPSCHPALLQGDTVQSIARRFVAASLIRSASGFKRSFRSSSFNSVKVNTSASLFISARATLIPHNPVSAPITLFIAAFTTTPTDDLFRQFMQAYIKDHWPLILAQTLALVEPKKQPLKAWYPDLKFGKSYEDSYRFGQQYEHYFDTARAIRNNRTPFTAFFLEQHQHLLDIVQTPACS